MGEELRDKTTQIAVAPPSPRRWQRRLRRWSSPALDLLFPPRCVGCGDDIEPPADEVHLCPSCRGVLAGASGSVCERCGAPVAEVAAATGDCPHCRGSRFHFDHVTALGVYQGPLREAVLRMKHLSGESLALAAGRLLGDRLLAATRTFDLAVPMPMHWTRRMWRSMNSAEVLAEAISSRLSLRLVGGALRFRRMIRQQSLLPPSRRRRNVRNAFGVAASYALADSRILLVDDILTTGATASAAAKILRNAGAAQVSVAVVGRGIGID